MSGASGSSDPSGRRILVVEDEFLIAVHLEDTLRQLGCVPIGPAFTLEGGMALAKASALSGALLDLNLAGKSSLPLAKELRAAGIPFAMVTCYDLDLIKAPELLGAQWVRKPFTDQDIQNVLRRWS